MREQVGYSGNSHGYVGARVMPRRKETGVAFELFMKADVDGLVGPGDLAILGDVAYAAGIST